LLSKFRSKEAMAEQPTLKQTPIFAYSAFRFVRTRLTQIKEGANRAARALLFQLPSLLLAPVAGSTTVGGIAACRVRRLHRSCETKRDHCHQHNCPNLLHGFFSFEKSDVIWSTDGDAISGTQGKLQAVISKCEAGEF
jgi:hypothetical protein